MCGLTPVVEHIALTPAVWRPSPDLEHIAPAPAVQGLAPVVESIVPEPAPDAEYHGSPAMSLLVSVATQEQGLSL